MKASSQVRKDILRNFFNSLLTVTNTQCFTWSENLEWDKLLTATSLILHRAQCSQPLEPSNAKKIVIQDIKEILNFSDKEIIDKFPNENDSWLEYKIGVIVITQGLISPASEAFIQAAIALNEKSQIELQSLIEETQRLLKIGNVDEIDAFFNSDSLIDTETSISMTRPDREEISTNLITLREKDSLIRSLNGKVQELEHLLMLAQRDYADMQQQVVQNKDLLGKAKEELRHVRHQLTDQSIHNSEVEMLKTQLDLSKEQADELTRKILTMQRLENENHEIIEQKLELQGVINSLQNEVNSLRELKHVKTRADQQNDVISLMTSQMNVLKSEIEKLEETSMRKDRTIQELLEQNERLRDVPASKSLEFDEEYGEKLVLYSGLLSRPPCHSKSTQCNHSYLPKERDKMMSISCQIKPNVISRECQTVEVSEEETDLLTEIQDVMNAETCVLQIELEETRKSLTDEIVQLNNVIREKDTNLEELREELVKLRNYSRSLEEQLKQALQDMQNHSSSAVATNGTASIETEEITPQKQLHQQQQTPKPSPIRQRTPKNGTTVKKTTSTPVDSRSSASSTNKSLLPSTRTPVRQASAQQNGLLEKLKQDKTVLQVTLFRLVKFIKRYFATQKEEEASRKGSSAPSSPKRTIGTASSTSTVDNSSLHSDSRFRNGVSTLKRVNRGGGARTHLQPMDLARLYELYERNLMQPLCLRSCYPVELQLFDDCELLDLAGKLLQESTTSLTPKSREEVQKVLETVITSTSNNGNT